MENRRSFIKKSGLFLALSSLSLSAFSSSFRRKNVPVENRTVTLYVNTDQIDKKDVNSFCNFGQAAGISNEDFVVDVNVGDTITWAGVSTNAPATDIVHIHSISHHHGKKIFDQDTIAGDESTRKVSRKVLYRTVGEQNYKYVLRFTVTRDGKRNGPFQIDPVIQVH